MKIPNYNEPLLKVVRQKLPEGTNHAAFLMDILCIGKVAAYRRLSGEVPLTLDEAVRIAKKLKISIDLTVGGSSENISAFRMCMTEFEDPSEADYRVLEEHVDLIKGAADDPESQLSMSVNMFPQQVYLQYENLTRFFLFEKAYHKKEKRVKAYHHVLIPSRMRRIFRDSFEAHRQFKTTHLVFDRYMLLYLIRNIKYFHHIGLIGIQDVELIRRDIRQLIAYLEKIAITGKYENGSQVFLYMSDVNFDKNCYNIKIRDMYINIMETYTLNGVASTSKEDYDRMEEWIISRCSLSTMISVCSELQRTQFFNEQRSLIETL